MSEARTCRGKPVIRVRITGATYPSWWYADMVGQEFDVVEAMGGYVLAEDYKDPIGGWCHIYPDDCMEVEP